MNTKKSAENYFRKIFPYTEVPRVKFDTVSEGASLFAAANAAGASLWKKSSTKGGWPDNHRHPSIGPLVHQTLA